MRQIILNIALVCLVSVGAMAQKKINQKVGDFDKNIKDKGTQLLDVRRPDEFEEGHIQGSKLANWEDKAEFEKQVADLDKDKPVYVYCRSGKRSSAAADYLSEQGFKNIVNLEGGILSWKQEGKAIESGEKKQAAISSHQH